MTAASAPASDRRQADHVTPLELFFDLTLVLAFIQSTNLMASGGAMPVVHGLLILGLLWYAWVSYSWLTSVIDPHTGILRLLLLLATGALLVVAISVPKAFDGGALTFAISYAVVRAVHLVLFFIASRDDDRLRGAIRGFTVSAVIGIALVLAGAFVDGEWRFGIWIVALVIDMAGPYVSGVAGWRLTPGHFAERHGHIVIIALGETIISIGVGVGTDLSASVVAACLVGFTLIAALWWLYFDLLAELAERRLRNAEDGREQNALARDAYSYLHFPMIAGIMLIALGLKHTLSHPGEEAGWVTSAALAGGFGLFLLGNYAFKVRMVGAIYQNRLVGGLLALVLVPFLPAVSAIIALGMVLLLAIATLVLDNLVHRQTRERLKKDLEVSVN